MNDLHLIMNCNSSNILIVRQSKRRFRCLYLSGVSLTIQFSLCRWLNAKMLTCKWHGRVTSILNVQWNIFETRFGVCSENKREDFLRVNSDFCASQLVHHTRKLPAAVWPTFSCWQCVPFTNTPPKTFTGKPPHTFAFIHFTFWSYIQGLSTISWIMTYRRSVSHSSVHVVHKRI